MIAWLPLPLLLSLVMVMMTAMAVGWLMGLSMTATAMLATTTTTTTVVAAPTTTLSRSTRSTLWHRRRLEDRGSRLACRSRRRCCPPQT